MRFEERREAAIRLADVVQYHRELSFRDSGTTQALLADTLSRDASRLRPEIDLLTRAVALGAPQQLIATRDSEQAVATLAAAGLAPADAAWAAEAWAVALGIPFTTKTTPNWRRVALIAGAVTAVLALIGGIGYAVIEDDDDDVAGTAATASPAPVVSDPPSPNGRPPNSEPTISTPPAELASERPAPEVRESEVALPTPPDDAPSPPPDAPPLVPNGEQPPSADLDAAARFASAFENDPDTLFRFAAQFIDTADECHSLTGSTFAEAAQCTYSNGAFVDFVRYTDASQFDERYQVLSTGESGAGELRGSVRAGTWTLDGQEQGATLEWRSESDGAVRAVLYFDDRWEG